MNILFVDNYQVNFGVAYLSAILKASGHDIQLLSVPLDKWKGLDAYDAPERCFDLDRIARIALAAKPDLIAFSVLSPNFMFYRRFSAILRSKTRVPMLVGGVLPTLQPDLFFESSPCDFVFRGEAERVIVELVSKIAAGTHQDVPNLAYRDAQGRVVKNDLSSFVEDLDAIPYYDKELYRNGTGWLHMLSSRGCVGRCAYCYAGAHSRLVVKPGAPIIRKRSAAAVVDEIAAALARRAYSGVFFYDDHFITTESWLADFAQRYAEKVALPFSCNAAPASITDGTARLLKAAGCCLVSFGFQTANEAYKSAVLKRNETKEQTRRALALLRQHGVTSSIDHLFNLPGETHEHIGEALDFYLETKANVTTYFLNYFPKAGVTEYALSRGLISKAVYDRINRNEMIGDQYFKGTIIDEARGKEQVRYAMLFRLSSLLPAGIIRWAFRKRLFRFLPASAWLFYFLSMIASLKDRGLKFVLILRFWYFNSGAQYPSSRDA